MKRNNRVSSKACFRLQILWYCHSALLSMSDLRSGIPPSPGRSDAVLQYSRWRPWMGLPWSSVFGIRSRWGYVHAWECTCAEPQHLEDLERADLHPTGGGGCLTVHPHSAYPQTGPGGWAGVILMSFDIHKCSRKGLQTVYSLLL